MGRCANVHHSCFRSPWHPGPRWGRSFGAGLRSFETPSQFRALGRRCLQMLRVCTSRAPVRGASHMSVPMCLFGATRFVSTGWSFGPGDCGRRRERRLGTFPAWPGSGAADRSLPGAKPAGSWTRPSAPAQVHSDCILQGWGLGPAAKGACQALRPHPSQPDSSPRISPPRTYIGAHSRWAPGPPLRAPAPPCRDLGICCRHGARM